MKKILVFFALFLCIIGVFGGIGSTLYHHDYVISLGIAVLGWMAYPKVREMLKHIMETDEK